LSTRDTVAVETPALSATASKFMDSERFDGMTVLLLAFSRLRAGHG